MSTKNIIIVGAGSAGKLLRDDIVKNYPDHSVLGFVDDSPRRGVKVIGNVAQLPLLLTKHTIDEIVIAIPSTDGALVRRILLDNRHTNIPITIVPRSQRVIRNSDVHYSAVKSLDFEDFLGRPFAKPNIKRLASFYQNKTVFITGGAGSIGSEIVRQLLDLGARRVVIYDHSEYLSFTLDQQLKEKGTDPSRYQIVIGNILNTKRVDHFLAEIKPDIVFHVAAYKHVYLMENNVTEAIQNNVFGTKAMADAALKHGVAQFTFISTDKVVNPQSIMGATKCLAEHYIQSLPKNKTKFTIVRFGNVINSQGSVLPLFERQIKDHKYVTITDKKMQRYFMSIREAAQLVIQSTARSTQGEVYVLNMGEIISIYEVALCLIRSLNYIPEKEVLIKIIGRKPGEKLVEELFTSAEKKHVIKTDMANIWRLKKHDSTLPSITSVLEVLQHYLSDYSHTDDIRRYLRQHFASL